VSQQRRIEQDSLLAVLGQAFDATALVTPQSWRLTFANPTLARWLRKPASELSGELLEAIFSSATPNELREQIEQVWQGKATDRAAIVFLRNDLNRRDPLELRVCRVVVGDEPLLALTLRSTPDSINYNAPAVSRRDPLTGLPDRAFLEARLAALLGGERSADRQFAVLFVDLDNFKQVNDAHGHVIGDHVLRECARRLAACVRQGDHVARFGGDEFVVLLEQVAGRAEIDPVIERIHLALGEAIELPRGEFSPRVSIGVAEATENHHSPEDLLHEADRAMYAAKRVRI
jgi:diguanylate cyclase (GGDEF)-like protein